MSRSGLAGNGQPHFYEELSLSDAANWPYGGGATGQPAPLAEGDFATAQRAPQLFGQGDRDLRGVPKVVQVTTPAVGADWSYVHSGPSWYLLRDVIAQLQTSAVAATRVARLQLLYQSVLAVQAPPTATQITALTVVYNGSTASLASGDPATALWCLPTDLIIKDGMTLRSNTLLLDVGDKWTAIALLVEEFTDKCLDVY
jgi:hypothetical protein